MFVNIAADGSLSFKKARSRPSWSTPKKIAPCARPIRIALAAPTAPMRRVQPEVADEPLRALRRSIQRIRPITYLFIAGDPALSGQSRIDSSQRPNPERTDRAADHGASQPDHAAAKRHVERAQSRLPAVSALSGQDDRVPRRRRASNCPSSSEVAKTVEATLAAARGCSRAPPTAPRTTSSESRAWGPRSNSCSIASACTTSGKWRRGAPTMCKPSTTCSRASRAGSSAISGCSKPAPSWKSRGSPRPLPRPRPTPRNQTRNDFFLAPNSANQHYQPG